jgi:predicted RNA binding protein YcfA (HicA-like mRNA interferase family)
MSKIEKLIAKFLKVPNDLTWEELVKILNHKGYYEKLGKGKTGGSRIKFVNSNNDILNLHKPHPTNIVKQYIIRQILEKLDF